MYIWKQSKNEFVIQHVRHTEIKTGHTNLETKRNIQNMKNVSNNTFYIQRVKPVSNLSHKLSQQLQNHLQLGLFTGII